MIGACVIVVVVGVHVVVIVHFVIEMTRGY